MFIVCYSLRFIIQENHGFPVKDYGYGSEQNWFIILTGCNWRYFFFRCRDLIWGHYGIGWGHNGIKGFTWLFADPLPIDNFQRIKKCDVMYGKPIQYRIQSKCALLLSIQF